MKINVDAFRVREGVKVRLPRWKTRITPLYRSESEAGALLAEQVNITSKLQNVLYAANRHALLLVFQAMDAAGKDGVIKHVMSGVNPAGCEVTSFKQPSQDELDHDFLWRTTRSLPRRGQIGIFNRSYYEEVLVVRVHPELLLKQKLPMPLPSGKRIWEQRYESIRNFEAHAARNGTHVVKFFLHVSKEEQRRRFLDRIERPEKNWKFDHGDIAERAHWDAYMTAYENCLSATSTEDAPWYVIPADDKRTARILVSRVVNQTLESMKLSYPAPGPEHLAELEQARRQLEEEGLQPVVSGRGSGKAKVPGASKRR